MLFVCRLACYQKLVWFKNKKIKEKQSCVLFYMYPPAPQLKLKEVKSFISHETKGFSQKKRFFPSSYIIPKLQQRNQEKTLIQEDMG